MSQIRAVVSGIREIFKSGATKHALGSLTAKRESQRGLFGVGGGYFSHKTQHDIPDENRYIKYPIVTKEEMKKITNDKYKFEVGYSSFAFHSDHTLPMVHSLSDLTDPTQLNTLLPRRRPIGSPADTLSIKAGDDAMLVSPTVLAIADGVSGWEDKEGNSSSGLWARSMLETMSRLMTEYKLSHVPHHLNKRDIDQVLDDSYLHTSHLMDLERLKGSSTLIMGIMSGDYLKMISIGDSKLYIIRDGEVIKTNEEQLISELCPRQIGTQTLDELPSDIAWVDSIKLEEGDILVVCSDGISDNLYQWEIVHYIDEFLSFNKGGLKAAANKLLTKAKEIAFDDYAYTPYNELVNSLPERFGKNNSTGGKLDDMSVCIARVTKNTREKI